MTPIPIRPIAHPAPITAPDYAAGLAAGVNMSDDEILRYANGIIATFVNPVLNPITSADVARKRLKHLMDMLAANGMIATIGYNGTAEIKPWVREVAQ